MTPLPLRRWFSGERLGACVLAAMAALTVARPTVADPPSQHSAGRATRKDRTVDESRAEEVLDVLRPVETWATLINVHTGDAMALSSAEPSQIRFSDALADRVTASRIDLDRRLLELLRQIAIHNPGARIELVSGYRSPKLNEMLRKKGHRVASHSQHSLGHAVDFRIIGLTPAKMKAEILKVGWEGGIGQYDKSSDLFVHADVGPKREWFERR